MQDASALFDREAIADEIRSLIEARHQIAEVAVQAPERRDNARTAIMEALTAAGHLSTVELHGATVDEINARVLARLLSGWDDNLPQHERDRRFAELCNELVIQKVHAGIMNGELPPDTEILEISDYPEPLRGYRLGYRDTNNKGMVRVTALRRNHEGHFTRVIETLSRSNSTSGSTASFFGRCGIGLSAQPADIAALETPLVYSRQDYADGIVDVMRQLDGLAGRNVLYGDTGERTRRHPAYHQLRRESIRREEEVARFVNDLALLEQRLDERLAAGQITRSERTRLFSEEIDRILSAICTLEPAYARDTFGPLAVRMFEDMAVLTAQGREAEAAELLAEHGYLKQAITFCGMTISLEEARAQGLPVNSYGQLVEAGKQYWKKKLGVCVVKNCPTRPNKTLVGPCSVCMGCQEKFDNHRDPTKEVRLPNLRDSRQLAARRAILGLWITKV